MIRRESLHAVRHALERQPVAALLGPRQVGKTTLALELADAEPSIYLDLQRADDRARLTDPAEYLERFEDRLVILDEIHHAPELFRELRGIIDRGRRRGRRTGRFLLLGSASIELLRQSSESLAGRIAFIELTPLRVSETGSARTEIERLWLRGGYPESYLARDDAVSAAIRRDFYQTLLRRDIAEFAPRISVAAIERCWRMLAHLHGETVNASSLAQSLGIDAKTVANYLDLLAELFLMRPLEPYFTNTKKRLVKAPRWYFRDTGMLHAVLEIESMHDLTGHPKYGKSWESFVIENLTFACGRTPLYYRTAAGAEIDLLFEDPRDGLIAVEIKRSQNQKPSNGFYLAHADLQPAKTYVVHGGEHRFPLRDGIEEIGLAELVAELTRR